LLGIIKNPNAVPTIAFLSLLQGKMELLPTPLLRLVLEVVVHVHLVGEDGMMENV